VFLELFVIGLVSLLGQIVLLRELSVASYGVELIYLLGMACWLIGSSLGSGFGQKRHTDHVAVLSIFLLYTLLLPLDMVFLRLSRWLLGGVTGAFLPFHLQLLTLIISVMPLSFLMGMAFKKAAGLLVITSRKPNSLAMAYGWECMGSVVAGGLATLGPVWHIPNLLMGIFCAAIPCLLILHRWIFMKRLRFMAASALILVTILGTLVIFIDPIDLFTSGFNHPFLKAVADTPYGRIAITSLEGQTTVFENDAVSFETESTSAEELAHLAALQLPSLKKALLLGGGLEGLVEELLKYASIEAVDYVELNEELIATTLPFLTDIRQRALKDSRVHIIYEDPRRFLRKRADAYDLILVAMPEPASGQANRFYTREFFQDCKARLSSKGVLGFRLSASENFWSQQLILRNRAIVSAAKEVFSQVLVLPGSINLVLAGAELTTDMKVLTQRYEAIGLNNRLVIPQYIQYLLFNDRFQEVAGHMWQGESGPINTDKRPVCYSLTIRLWLSKFFPGLLTSNLAFMADTPVLWGMQPHHLLLMAGLLGLTGLFYLIRGRPMLFKAGLMCWAAFWGTVLETVLLLQYQVSNAALYGELGLLLMALMVGMTLGAMAFKALSGTKIVRIGLIVAMACTGLGVAWGVHQGILSQFASIGTAMLLCGFLLAGTFAHLSQDRSQERLVAPLYTADLVGGAMGTIFSALYAIPFWGLDQTSLAVGMWSIGALLSP